MADAIEFDSSRAADYELRVDVGEPESLDGQTSVTVDGTGSMVIEHVTVGKGKEAVAEPRAWRMEPAAVQPLLAIAASFDWKCPFPQRKGIPDEAVVRWTIHDRKGGEVTCRTWLRDAEKNETMRKVLDALRAELGKATNGALYL